MEDRNTNKDSEWLNFDIYEDDLLEYSESVFMVGTISSSHHKLPPCAVSKDADIYWERWDARIKITTTNMTSLKGWANQPHVAYHGWSKDLVDDVKESWLVNFAITN